MTEPIGRALTTRSHFCKGETTAAGFQEPLIPNDENRTLIMATFGTSSLGRLSLLRWNPGLNRGMPTAISRLLVVPWHVVALQEPGSHITSDAFAVHIQISQHEDCGVLFNKNTFSRVEAPGVFVGPVREYTDWALRGFCAQAWFRCVSTGTRTDVQMQERVSPTFSLWPKGL